MGYRTNLVLISICFILAREIYGAITINIFGLVIGLSAILFILSLNCLALVLLVSLQNGCIDISDIGR